VAHDNASTQGARYTYFHHSSLHLAFKVVQELRANTQGKEKIRTHKLS
jgi:hypothetical protein